MMKAQSQLSAADVGKQNEVLFEEESYSDKTFIDAGLEFNPQCNHEISTKIPDDVKLRPFYFIKLLQKSMTSGAFISGSVFVNKLVWE